MIRCGHNLIHTGYGELFSRVAGLLRLINQGAGEVLPRDLRDSCRVHQEDFRPKPVMDIAVP